MRGLIHAIPRWRPDLPPVSRLEQVRSCAGALIGIAATGFVTRWVLGSNASVPLLVAPMGASAVLLFAVPASPLAQPWSILGGNVTSAFIGIAVRTLIDEPFVAAAVGCSAAIGAMFILGCLHPPGGAAALVAVLGGPAVEDAGWSFALYPVGLNSLLLLSTALIFNRAAGRHYPHLRAARGNLHRTSDALPTARMGPAPEDVEAALAGRGEMIDVAPGDLRAILDEAELHALRRHFGDIVCRDIMSRDVATVTASTTPKEAWALLNRHRIKALPVLDGTRQVLGIVTQTDFVEEARWDETESAMPLRERVRRGLRLAPTNHRTIATMMTAPARTASTDTPITDLIPAMADRGLHHLPVTDGTGRLAGIVTQSDLIAALYRNCLDHRGEPRSDAVTTPSNRHRP